MIVRRTKEGQELRGIRRSEDGFSVLMTDASEKLVRIDKRNLSDQRTELTWLMSADYGQRLSAAEIQSLVAYLRAQNGLLGMAVFACLLRVPASC